MKLKKLYLSDISRAELILRNSSIKVDKEKYSICGGSALMNDIAPLSGQKLHNAFSPV